MNMGKVAAASSLDWKSDTFTLGILPGFKLLGDHYKCRLTLWKDKYCQVLRCRHGGECGERGGAAYYNSLCSAGRTEKYHSIVIKRIPVGTE